MGSSGRRKKSKKTKSAWGTLIRRLRSVPEVGMRRQLLLEQLRSMQPADALAFFTEVVAGAATRKAAYDASIQYNADAKNILKT